MLKYNFECADMEYQMSSALLKEFVHGLVKI